MQATEFDGRNFLSLVDELFKFGDDARSPTGLLRTDSGELASCLPILEGLKPRAARPDRSEARVRAARDGDAPWELSRLVSDSDP
jgi:hypothetical protein